MESINLQSQREIERKKYQWINENDKTYGSSFHGKRIVDFLLHNKKNISSIVDIGTGRGEFCKWAAENLCEEVYGVDFVFEPYENNKHKNITYYKTYAHDLPFENKQIDILTSFDMLEHLVEEDVDIVLKEFYRVTSKKFIFSICTNDSCSFRDNVGTLHPTVKDLNWWHNKISKYGKIERYNGYTIVTL